MALEQPDVVLGAWARITNMKSLPYQSLLSRAAFPYWGTVKESSSTENDPLSQFSQGIIYLLPFLDA